MRYVGDETEQFPVCDLCERDESGGIGKVHEIGKSGICDSCLVALRMLLSAHE